MSLLSRVFSPTEDTSTVPGGTPEIGSSHRSCPPVVHLLRVAGHPTRHPLPCSTETREVGRKPWGVGLPIELVCGRGGPRDPGFQPDRRTTCEQASGPGNPRRHDHVTGPPFSAGGRPWPTARSLERRPECPADLMKNAM